MKYNIIAEINNETVLESTLETSKGNLAFWNIREIVESISEEAYESPDSTWSVTVTSENGSIQFRLDDEYIRTIVDEKDMGVGFWDHYLDRFLFS